MSNRAMLLHLSKFQLEVVDMSKGKHFGMRTIQFADYCTAARHPSGGGRTSYHRDDCRHRDRPRRLDCSRRPGHSRGVSTLVSPAPSSSSDAGTYRLEFLPVANTVLRSPTVASRKPWSTKSSLQVNDTARVDVALTLDKSARP